jgi:pimeloyl-ACP methyl ester carboxylesterase
VRVDRPGLGDSPAHAATDPAALRAQADAAAAVPTSRRQLRELTASASFPAVAVRVLTPDSPPVNRIDRLVRAQNLTELHPREAAASPRGSHHVVTGSSHMVHLDQPEALAEHIALAVDT